MNRLYPKSVAEEGVITIARGARQYVQLGITLAKSLRVTNSGLPLAVIADEPDPELSSVFDLVIMHDEVCGDGWLEKLRLDHYTPFEKTLYLDGDSLAIRDMSTFWRDVEPYAFTSVVDAEMTEGYWYTDIRRWCAAIGVSSITRANGGFLYFDRSPASDRVFNAARNALSRYDELGFRRIHGQTSDEPLWATVLAQMGMPIYRDDGMVSAIVMDCESPLKLDVLRGICRYSRDGRRFSPSVVHFAGGYWEYHHYRRERVKLNLAVKFPCCPRALLSFGINAVLNTCYAAAMIVRRIVRFVLRGQKPANRFLLPACPWT